MKALQGEGAQAPALFWFELRNSFLMAEQVGRLRSGEALLSMVQLRGLPIEELLGPLADGKPLDP